MKNRLFVILPFLLSLTFFKANATHIVGGEFTYLYLGDSSSGGNVYHKYQVSLSIYEDCINGQPEAIAQDNPAFIGVFDAATKARCQMDTNIFFYFFSYGASEFQQ